jgi:hypothetical protein
MPGSCAYGWASLFVWAATVAAGALLRGLGSAYCSHFSCWQWCGNNHVGGCRGATTSELFSVSRCLHMMGCVEVEARGGADAPSHPYPPRGGSASGHVFDSTRGRCPPVQSNPTPHLTLTPPHPTPPNPHARTHAHTQHLLRDSE